jgi:hypothetical protein
MSDSKIPSGANRRKNELQNRKKIRSTLIRVARVVTKMFAILTQLSERRQRPKFLNVSITWQSLLVFIVQSQLTENHGST